MKVAVLLVLGIVLFCFVVCQKKISDSSAKQKAVLSFPYEMEGFKTNKNTVEFGNVYFGDTPADTIWVYNPVEGKLRSCQFSYDIHSLRIVSVPQWLNPGDTGMVIVKLLTSELGQYGDILKRVRWMDKDGIPGIHMAVSAHVTENFQELSGSERRDAPSIYIAEQKHDFGQVEAGKQLMWKARIENHGKKELIIRNIKTSCGCTAVMPEKRMIAAGDSCQLNITFNTTGREGVQHKTISLMCNDWRRPEVMLSFRAEVSKSVTDDK